MKKLILFCLAAATCACAPGTHPQPSPASPAIARPAAQTAPDTQVGPRFEGTLPDQPAALASVDPIALQSFLSGLAKRLLPNLTSELEVGLGLAPGSLATENLIADSGIDPTRPIVIGVARLDPSALPLLETGRSQLGHTSADAPGVPDLAKRIGKALYARREPHTHLRVIVPARDTSALLRRVHALLAARRYWPIGTTAELESVHARRERAVALSVLPDRVIADIFVFSRAPRTSVIIEAAATAHRRLCASRGPQPLPLEGHAATVWQTPALLAELGFVEAMSRAHEGLPRRGGARDWYMVAGLHDANKLLSLAKGAQGPYFDTAQLAVDLRDGLPDVELRATFGAAVPRPAEAACAPSVSVDFPNALARFDLTTSCMRALQAPGDPAGDLAYSTFSSLVQDMTWVGWAVALPAYPLGATRQPLSWDAGVRPRAIMRFERFGWANQAFGAPDVFWGLLPSNATAEQIACAVDDFGDGCQGKRRIQPRRINDLGGSYARVISVGGRSIVMTSRDRNAVMRLVPVLTAKPVPPMRAAVSKGTMQRALDGLAPSMPPIQLAGELRVEGDRIVVKAGPRD